MLVIRQVEGAWKVKQPHLRPLLDEARAPARGRTRRSTSSTSRARRTPTPTRWSTPRSTCPEIGSDVFFWYVGMSVLLVANVFRSTGVDYRLIAVGALLPLAGRRYRSATERSGTRWRSPSLLLVVVMVATIGRPRLLRRRLLCIPIGVFFGLVLSGAWTTDGFWWPFTAWDDADLLPAWWVVVARGAGRAVRVLVGHRPVRPLPARATPRVLAQRPVEGGRPVRPAR